MKKIETYYDDHYFNFHQRKIGIFGAKANLFKFSKHINSNFKIIILNINLYVIVAQVR